MPLTSFGRPLTILTCVLAISSVFFMDIALAIAAFIITLLLVNEWAEVKLATARLKDEVKFEESKLALKIVAGEIESVKMNVGSKSRFRIRVEPLFTWSSVDPNEIHEGNAELTLKFSPELAGEYDSEGFPVTYFGKRGLVQAAQRYAFPIQIKVYPRVLPVIVKAIEFLVKAGSKGVGDEPTEVKGRGLEYAGTREYLPGDTLRRIDHKASAKLGKLMIKEFYAEAGLIVHLMYDIGAIGPKSKDELASAFLNTALGLAIGGVPFGLTVHDGETVFVHLEPVNPSTALEAALKHVLSSAEVEPEDLDALLEPRVSAKVNLLFVKLKASPLGPFIEASKERLKEPYLAVRRMAEESSSPINIIAVTGLIGTITPLMELSKTLAHKMGELRLILPCRPWLEAETLERAYRLYSRSSRAKRLLQSAGIRIEEQLTLRKPSKKFSDAIPHVTG